MHSIMQVKQLRTRVGGEGEKDAHTYVESIY